MILAAVLCATLSTVSPEGIEDAAARTMGLAYERAGRRTPTRDGPLSAAARALAKEALDAPAQAVAELVPLTEAVSLAGGWEPSPRILVVKGAPIDEPLRMLARRSDLAEASATHAGVGAVTRGDASALVILLTERRVRLDAFPRRLASPVSSQPLCGELEPPFAQPEVYVTIPSGAVERPAFTRHAQRRFCARLSLAAEGRYTVEVIGRGPRGPEVAALFFVDVGAAARRAEGSVAPEPSSLDEARSVIVDRINALRRAHGVAPLRIDPEVTRAAQGYSERMAKERFFSHVAPDGTTVSQRLKAEGVPHQAAGENLGTAHAPLAAHFGIEHSPGHRRNLLDSRWTLVGIGVAEQQVEGRRQVVLAEVFVEPHPPSADPVADAYRAIAQRRAALKLPPLRRIAELEKLAQAHARRALAMDEPKVELVDANLHRRVFDAVDEVGAAAIDSYISEVPVPPDESRVITDARNAFVGVGVVKGDSPRFGKGKYWVVVIYATRR